MRGKFMPTAVMLLLAWNSNCFAVNTGHSVISSASGYDVKSVLPLPSVSVRSELTQQLMEIAMTGIHPVFADTWLQLSNELELAQDPETYYRIYSLLQQFRREWHALDWDSRERFHLKSFNPSTSATGRHAYN